MNFPYMALLAVLSIPSAFAGDFIVVDPLGGGDFVSIGAAYSAASDGDTIFVDSAPTFALSTIVLAGKGVTLVFDDDIVEYPRSFVIESIQAPSRFVLRGLQLGRGERIQVANCSGSVLLTGVSTSVGQLPYLEIGEPFEITDCASVIVRQCAFSARMLDYGFSSGIAWPVLQVRSSTVLFEDSLLEGRQGEDGDDLGGLCSSCCWDGYPGGIGIEVLGPSVIRAVNSTFVGGLGGIYHGGNGCSDGPAAPPVRIDPAATMVAVGCMFVEPVPIEGAVQVIAETPRTMTAPMSVMAGGTFSLELTGEPGDTAFLFGSGELVSRPRTPEEGFFQVIGVGRRRVGSLPSTGTRTLVFTAPTIGTPSTVFSLPLQVVYLLPTGGVRFSAATIVDIRGPGVPAW